MLPVAIIKRVRVGGSGDSVAPTGYAIAFTANTYTEAIDDSSVNLDVTGAEVGAGWALTISSSGGGTNVTDSGTVATANFTISGKNLTGLNPGTLTASLVLTDAALNAGSPATDTATLSAAGYTFTNAEAETVVNAFSVEPDDTRKALIDTLVGSLKTAGVWTKLDLLYVLAAADEQSAKVNWINPGTNDLTNNNSTTFTADVGFTGNGSSMSLTPGIAPNALTQLQQNSAHIGLWVGGSNSQSDAYEIGQTTPSGLRARVRAASDMAQALVNTVAAASANNTDSTGHFVFNRSASAALQIYRNGVSIGTDTDASAARSSVAISLLRDGSTYSSRVLQVAHVGASLDATDADEACDAFVAYLGAL